MIQDRYHLALCVNVTQKGAQKLSFILASSRLQSNQTMALQAVLILLISVGVSLSASLSCGSVDTCSKDYDADCPSDHSCDFYDNCALNDVASGCGGPLRATPSL